MFFPDSSAVSQRRGVSGRAYALGMHGLPRAAFATHPFDDITDIAAAHSHAMPSAYHALHSIRTAECLKNRQNPATMVPTAHHPGTMLRPTLRANRRESADNAASACGKRVQAAPGRTPFPRRQLKRSSGRTAAQPGTRSLRSPAPRPARFAPSPRMTTCPRSAASSMRCSSDRRNRRSTSRSRPPRSGSCSAA